MLVKGFEFLMFFSLASARKCPWQWLFAFCETLSPGAKCRTTRFIFINNESMAEAARTFSIVRPHILLLTVIVSHLPYLSHFEHSFSLRIASVWIMEDS